MKKYLQYVYRPVKWLLKCLSLLLSVVAISWKLIVNWRVISQSEVLIVYHQGGFGHTIHGPDLVRRLFPGRQITIIYFLQRSVHNPLVSQIWPDLKLIFLPIEFMVGRPGRRWRLPWFIGLKSEWLLFWMRRLFPEKTVLSPFEILDLCRARAEHAQDRVAGADWYFGYFNLLETVPAAVPALPAVLKNEVEAALMRRAPDRKKLCCLYLRARGSIHDVDKSALRRSGSPLTAYWPALRALNARGYTVLLVGDRTLDPATKTTFGDGVLDAAALGLSHDLLYLFAALECDVAVLENGGGAWLPIYRDKPHLVVNAVPFLFASPGGTIYYKSIRNADGAPVDARLLFGPWAKEYEFEGHAVCDNDESELGAAVIDFLENLEAPRPWGIAASRVAELSPPSWHRVLRSGVSPEWLARYGGSAWASHAMRRTGTVGTAGA